MYLEIFVSLVLHGILHVLGWPYAAAAFLLFEIYRWVKKARRYRRNLRPRRR